MKSKPSTLRTFTRLAVGGVFLAIEQMDRVIAHRGAKPAGAEPEVIDLEQPPAPGEEMAAGITGILFDAEGQLQKGFSRFNRLTAWAYNKTNQLTQPLTSSRLSRPFTAGFDQLVDRGEQVWYRWVDIGRTEHRQSRTIATQATNDSIDFFIDHLSENQEIRELVQSQSIGLAGVIVEELRQRGVSADTFLEVFVRNLLRMPQRDPRVVPADEVIESARPPRQIRGRVYRE